MLISFCIQVATDIAQLLKKPSFSEPRLMIFKGDSVQGFIVAEKEIMQDLLTHCNTFSLYCCITFSLYHYITLSLYHLFSINIIILNNSLITNTFKFVK